MRLTNLKVTTHTIYNDLNWINLRFFLNSIFLFNYGCSYYALRYFNYFNMEMVELNAIEPWSYILFVVSNYRSKYYIWGMERIPLAMFIAPLVKI